LETLKENIIVFGVGKNYSDNKELLSNKYNIIALCDNSVEKQGAIIDGYKCIAPTDIANLNYDKVIVTPNHYYSMIRQLLELGIAKEKITDYKGLLTLPATTKFCPICSEKSYFLPFGENPRQEVLCSHCKSLERHRLTYLFLKEKTDFFKNNSARKMLHIAPENCFEKLFRSTIGDGYITADLFNPNVMVKMDIMNIQYEDETFDIIYCSHVLEHVSDDKKAIKEFFRVLKKGGWAILNVPIIRDKTFEDSTITSPEERSKHYGQFDHVRAYGLDYIDRLREAGFEVIVTEPKDFLASFDIDNMKLIGEVYFCTRKSEK
jgi:predicted SAM-dependent methyltransferase